MEEVNAIIQQNKLLQEQNDLLREQNELLRQSISNRKANNLSGGGGYFYLLNKGREVFFENLYSDEMREGFLVTSHRKKLWNVQLGLIQEFAAICKKHNLRWFAYAGTLLGAVRHKGFIPWDDDMDVCMFRPDYEKLKSIVEDELRYNPNFRMWYWFNYRLETDSEAAKQVSMDLPLVSKAQADKYPGWAPLLPFMRLLDERTTYLFRDSRKDVFYATFLDIFPLDPCPPFEDEKMLSNFNVARELYTATIYPEKTKAKIESNKDTAIPREELLEYLELPYKLRAQKYELFLMKNFVQSPYVSEMRFYPKRKFKSEDFEKTVYLPFESIEVPAPVGYESFLTDFYGDWHKFVVKRGHGHKYSSDIPYKEYFSQTVKD